MKKLTFKSSKGLAIGVILGALLGSTPAIAAPSAITIGDFSGSENIIDFNTVGDEHQINIQYSNMCVTFSGAIYGMTNSGDLNQFPNNGGVIASNWLYDGGGNQGPSFSVELGASFTKVGFNVETNSGDDTTIEISVNSVSGGSVSFVTDIDGSQFIGVEDAAGFDSITVSVENNQNGFLAIDDLRFEGATLCSGSGPLPPLVPVPSLSFTGLLTLVAALFGFGMFRLRRKTQ